MCTLESTSLFCLENVIGYTDEVLYSRFRLEIRDKRWRSFNFVKFSCTRTAKLKSFVGRHEHYTRKTIDGTGCVIQVQQVPHR